MAPAEPESGTYPSLPLQIELRSAGGLCYPNAVKTILTYTSLNLTKEQK